MPELAQKHMGRRCYQDDPTIHYLYLFLYLSRNRNMPLSEECSPDAQKHQDRIVTSTILVKKLQIYKDLSKLNTIGYTEEWSREMLPL